MARYHINPKTGMPSVCHAQKGQCPYGGPSGNDNHFETYSMALAKSQTMLEDEHSLLPETDNALNGYGLSDEDWDLYEEIVDEKEEESEEEIIEELLNTEDIGLLTDVIEGRKYAEKGWDRIAMALQNPNLPRQMIEEMLFIYPNSYSQEARRHLVLNNSLDRKTLKRILEEDDDEVMHALVYKHTRFDLNIINHHIENEKELLTKMPHYFMIENPAVSEEDVDKWYDWVVSKDIYIDTSEINSISMKYTDWMVTHYEGNK